MQSTYYLCSAPLNRQSAADLRNARMANRPEWQRVCYPTSGGQNGIDLQCHATNRKANTAHIQRDRGRIGWTHNTV
jgi:hypothetical protein